MDWLRSEDLKEEKNVTAPIVIIAVRALCRLEEAAGRTRCNSPTRSCSSRSDFNLTIPNWAGEVFEVRENIKTEV
jgi:hypothetical protein